MSNSEIFQIDTETFIFGDFISKVVKSRLGFVSPSVMIGSSIIYEEGEDVEDEFAGFLVRRLAECPAGGIRNGRIVQITDFRQNLEVHCCQPSLIYL